MLGARRFNDIQRGVPRMSPALLSRRLKTLTRAGIIEPQKVGARSEYVLTEAGHALVPAIENLAKWGKSWLPATLSDGESDPDLVMWDMHRRMNCDCMPGKRTVIQFEFTDQPDAKKLRWIVSSGSAAELCITDPGLEVDLFVITDSRTITLVWYGDLGLASVIRDGSVVLHGPPQLCDAFPSWLQLSPMAGVPRQSLAEN